jgi:GT2 family glycosyltransferase
MNQVGAVVIGRNEGERLRTCLSSLRGNLPAIVYVDSGSTDGSVEMARAMGVDVVALDMSTPFTAARARNAGFKRLMEAHPGIELVQFVDGDCEMSVDWLRIAVDFLDSRTDVACVCGRLRERFPERSVYNRLCDFEWNRPPGQVDACGGIAMMRTKVVADAGLFREDMVAGEEPELCHRMRAAGWKIWRLPNDMALHDAAMLRFGQWWKRTKRTGFGNAQSMWLLRTRAERPLVLQAVRAWVWAGLLPFSIVVLSVGLSRWFAWLALLYPLQVLRIASSIRTDWRFAFERAFFLVLGKFPELRGHLQFLMDRRTRQGSAPFDYKS